MKRLWVQLSLASAGLIVGVMLLTLIISGLLLSTATLSSDGPAPENPEDTAVDEEPDNGNAIPDELLIGVLFTAIFSGLVGILSGIILSRRLSAPLSQLATAAQVIGTGELDHRVEVEGSQEIIELGQAFNQMATDLQHAEVLRRNLMADVSHELRTPLTVLKGQLRAALDHIYTFDEVEIAKLYQQTDHLIRLVNDLHELAQAEARQLPLTKSPTDLVQLLYEVIQTFAPLAEEKQITLTSEIIEPLPRMNIDSARLRQVLHNLLGNALQYTSSGGRIRLCAKTYPQEICISVQDSGVGIAPQHIVHIFDRFFRVDSSRSRHTGGTGLGLAVAKAIIEAHGGNITAHSAGIHQGSTFTITLPRQ